MFMILFCLARTFLPDAATLASDFQVQAIILAVTVFAFIPYRLHLDSRSRPMRSPDRVADSAPQ
jgi:hypothetical protein